MVNFINKLPQDVINKLLLKYVPKAIIKKNVKENKAKVHKIKDELRRMVDGDKVAKERKELRENNEDQQGQINLSHTNLYDHNIVDEARALKGAIVTKTWSQIFLNDEGDTYNTPKTFFVNIVGNDMKVYIENLLKENNNKAQLTLYAKFKKPTQEVITFCSLPVKSQIYIFTQGNDIDETITLMLHEIQETIEDIHVRGSGWILDSIVKLTLETLIYKPFKGSSYIDLPDHIKNKQACINVHNNDDKCFKWAVLSGLHPTNNNASKVTSYEEFESNYNFKCLTYPVEVKNSNFIKFENHNSEISVSVYILTKTNDVVPIYISQEVRPNNINLLLIIKGEKSHYVLIKNMSKLLATKSCHKELFYCRYCCIPFRTQEKLNYHLNYSRCFDRDSITKDIMPEEGETIEFNGHDKSVKAPIVLYGDFESYLYKMDKTTTNTQRLQQHLPSGFMLIAVNQLTGSIVKSLLYTGEDVMNVFYKTLDDWHDELQDIIKENIPFIMSEEDNIKYKSGKCHICKHQCVNKVRDHDHKTGKFIGPACNACNLKRKTTNKIPIFFHNGKGYDNHLIIKALKDEHNKRLSCIAQNFEKFISFSIGNYVFKDSLQFMAASLDSLSKNLSMEDKQITINHYKEQGYNDEDINLVLKKGFFPYDWFDSLDKLNNTCLPPIECFYNGLEGKELALKDYLHAKLVWKRFNCKTFKDYHDIYLKTDVFLLADVFENFRKVCYNIYELDPAHYYTAPGLSWDAMLKYTGVELDLLSDVDMYRFFELGIRGGISMISHRYAKANNKYMANYDPRQKSKYLLYLDANNLYGWAMSQKLPTGKFKWVENIDINTIDLDGDKGYVFQVDLEYPKELHDKHNCYPLAPERLAIKDEWLSGYQHELLGKLDMKNSHIPKLTPNLFDKSHYIVHAKNLKFYLDQGLILTKVHRALSFDQSPWLEKYINKNTVERTKAKNDFEKDFYKLMNNSVFGKTMENIRNRTDIKFAQSAKLMTKWASNPMYADSQIINEDLVAVQMKKTITQLNKPIYLGMCILDLSKLHMFNFHYNYIVKKYGDKSKLMFTDTDSLTYSIECEDVYADMAENKELFDMSEYSKENPVYDTSNKKVIGKFKDECSNYLMIEFVGVRPKCYAFSKESNIGIEEKKTLKGIKKSVVQNNINLQDYKNCVLDNKTKYDNMKTFRSYDHNVFTINTKKMSLCNFDNKRFICQDGINTRALGHYRNNF